MKAGGENEERDHLKFASKHKNKDDMSEKV